MSDRQESRASRIARFQTTGQQAHDARLRVNAAFKAGLRNRDPAAYQEMLHAFHVAMGKAWPGADDKDDRFTAKIKEGDPDAIETAIAFLEADPYFFRSGYLKQVILRRLKQAPLTRRQKAKLQALVIDAITQRHRFQFADYARLAPVVATPDFVAKLQALVQSGNDDVRQRASRVLTLVKTR